MSQYYKRRKAYPDLRKARKHAWLRRPADPWVIFANEFLRFCLSILVVLVAWAIVLMLSV